MLPAPESPERALEVKADSIERIIALARTQFDFVILDMGRVIESVGDQGARRIGRDLPGDAVHGAVHPRRQAAADDDDDAGLCAREGASDRQPLPEGYATSPRKTSSGRSAR